jgi:hypothetical protein
MPNKLVEKPPKGGDQKPTPATPRVTYKKQKNMWVDSEKFRKVYIKLPTDWH